MIGLKRIQHCSIPMPQGANDEARRFYGELLGLEEIPAPTTLDYTRLVWFRLGNDGDELHVFAQDGFAPNAPGQHLCLEVADVTRVRRDLEAKGIQLDEEPDIHNRPRFSLRDPFDNKIEITEILGPYTGA